MKQLFLLALCALILLVGQGTGAAQDGGMSDVPQLERFAGTWYDADGREVVTIGDGRINGCPVIEVGSFVGSAACGAGAFRIMEAAGPRSIQIGWTNFGDDQYFITVDGGEGLLRGTPTYYEMVGGVAPGMRMRDVTQRFGTEVKLTTEAPLTAGGRTYSYGSYYPAQKVLVCAQSGMVTTIALLPGSPLHFDRSGLTMDSSLEEFARAYGLRRTPQEQTERSVAPAYIGHGQILHFGKNRSFVTLTLYDT